MNEITIQPKYRVGQIVMVHFDNNLIGQIVGMRWYHSRHRWEYNVEYPSPINPIYTRELQIEEHEIKRVVEDE